MSDASGSTQACQPPKKRLSFLDEFLTLWIFIAMIVGIGLGYLFPDLAGALDSVKVFDVSLPIAVGLLVMMYPPLAKVHYDELGKLRQAKRMVGTSLLLNWIVGPVLMFLLAWLAFPARTRHQHRSGPGSF